MVRTLNMMAVMAFMGGCNSTLSAFDAVPTDTDVDSSDTDGAPADPTDDTSAPPTTDTGERTLPPGSTEVMIDGLDPAFGTDAGGSRVTIIGGPFDNLQEVTFAGQPATIISNTSNEVVVDTPASATDGWVDVHAVTSEGLSLSPAQFQYWEDGAGLNGAVGAVEWYAYVGGYWADPQPQPYGFGQAFFTTPMSEGFGQAFFSPTLDSCTLNYAGAGVTVYLPDLPHLDLAPPAGATVPLVQDSTPNFEYFYFNSPESLPGHNPKLAAAMLGGHFDLATTTGSPDWPEIDVPHFTGTVPTAPPVVTNPALASTNPPSVNASFTLQWGGTPADYVAARLTRQRFDGTNWINQEVVTCWFADDGSATVPNLWSSWDSQSDGVQFIVGRYNEPPPSATLPHNGARSQVVGAHWTFGFAIAQ